VGGDDQNKTRPTKITEILREERRDERAEQKVYNRVEHIGNRSKAY
jgi:hypothetical protein